MEKDQDINTLNAQMENLKSTIENLSDSLESTTMSLSCVEKEKTRLCSELDEVS